MIKMRLRVQGKLIIATILLIGLIFNSCDKPPIEPDDEQIVEALAGGGFNTWVEVIQGEVRFEKPYGDWWDGLNYLSVIGGPITATKTENSFKGAYALHLETKYWGDDLTIPGIMASGYFDPQAPIGENLIIGKPFNKKPLSLNGYLQYYPADNDTLVIFIALSKYNPESMIRDTIARGEYTYSGIIDTYTAFSIPIVYAENVEPDSIHVILLSSVAGKEMKGHAGSILIIDELSLSYEQE